MLGIRSLFNVSSKRAGSSLIDIGHSGNIGGRVVLVFQQKRNYCSCGGTEHSHHELGQQQQPSQHVRVRYAPSPTGYLHLGGLRTALFNYLFAKKNKGTFIMRIEDTDQTRFVPGSAKNLENCLEWAGIPYDEGPSRPGQCGPYVQSERLDIYKQYAQKLVESGHAYHCFCSSERLDASRLNLKNKYAMSLYDRHCLKLSREEIQTRLDRGDAHTIRLKIPHEKTTKFTDVVKGNVSFQNHLIDDQVLMKSDGFPTYHLASVVDDHLMGISHIIRGEEWLNSAPKHMILYEAFGWKPPIMAHVPLLLNSDKSKLSKRQGDVSVDSYMNKGFLPEALVNFVAFLGWSPEVKEGETPKEIMELDELIEKFSLEGINKSGSVVGMDRLDWFNVNHIRKMLMDKEKVVNFFLPKIKQQLLDMNIDIANVSDQYIIEAIQCVKDRVHVVDDFQSLLKGFFVSEIDYTTEEAMKMKAKVWKSDSKANVTTFATLLSQIPDSDFNADEIYKTLQIAANSIYQGLNEKELSQKVNQLMSNIRYLLLASPVGGGIPSTIQILGKENTLKRLGDGLNKQQ
ncbi:hypothetical protein CYY_008908 [Polysphondylium violaceum]|uniref:glutamate--tRNA ligase n=1 Tax=Polysphondylium violaceum TaxID=133409 RepID=A0A8J4PPQ8_9MYCE|nr:hypothetical protein CYY_008908 [Polysphondylium violaceum]